MSRVSDSEKKMKEFSAVLLTSTEKAWMMTIGEHDYWVPKSVCKWKAAMPDSDEGTVSIPMWFVKKNEMDQ